MQLTNGVQTLDAYQPTFDPGLDVATVVFSHIECVKTRASLATVSKLWRDASKPTAAYPRFFDFDGVAGDVAGHLVRLLDDDRVRSLGKERALELIGVHKDRLCEYACGRNFKVLKWAFNELNLPWAQYPAEPVSDDILVLRVLLEMWPKLKEVWPENEQPEDWEGVTMENGRVVELRCGGLGLTGAVPAEIGQLTSLTELHLRGNQLTSLPVEVRQLTSLMYLNLGGNQLTSVPVETWQLTSLEALYLHDNKLTTLPADIGQLTSLMYLDLTDNQLMSVPSEIGQLTSLKQLGLYGNQLTSVPAEIGQLTSLEELYVGWNQLTSVPSEIGQLTSLEKLWFDANQLTSLPAEIGQLTSLRQLWLDDNKLTSVPAAIREFRAAGCEVKLDEGVTFDE